MANGSAFLNLEEQAFVLLAGPDEVSGAWHVNEHILISEGTDPMGMLTRVASGGDAGEGTRHGYILQPADASAKWLIVVVKETPEGGTVEKLAIVDGLNGDPQGVNGPISVESIAASQDELDG